jgi:hypothetical protein
MMTATFDPQQDLRDRWKPSEEQVAEAAEFWAAHPQGRDVLTAHLLVGKYNGFWADGIEVVPVPGVFTDRLDAWVALERLVKAKGEQTGKPVTGGYAYHHEDGGWAVFEDASEYVPEEG